MKMLKAYIVKILKKLKNREAKDYFDPYSGTVALAKTRNKDSENN